MPSIQEALAAALAAPAKPATKPASKPAKPARPATKPANPAPKVPDRPQAVTVAPGVRRVPLFTLSDHYPLRPAVIEHERHSKSAPPPEHEPNFAERYFSRSYQ